MDYSDYDFEAEELARKRRFWLQLAGGLAVFLIACGTLYWYDRTFNLSTEERFENEVAANENVGIALKVMQAKFPYDYRRLRTDTAEAYNLEKTGKVLDRLPLKFMDGFIKRHGAEALMGGDKEAFAFVDSYAAIMDIAARDKAMCQVIMGNEDKASDTLLILSQKPISQMFAAFITLAAAGRDHPVTRTPLSPSELSAFYAQGRKMTQEIVQSNDADKGLAARCKREDQFFKAVQAQEPSRRILFISLFLQLIR